MEKKWSLRQEGDDGGGLNKTKCSDPPDWDEMRSGT